MNLKKYFLFAAFLSVNLLLGLVFFKPNSSDVAKILNSLSKEDKESLTWLFRGFSSSHYVLFGNKPMAFHGIKQGDYSLNSNPYRFIDSITTLHISSLKEVNGLKCWEKNKHLFPSSNFALLKNTTPENTTIFLINKPLFLQRVEENIDCFKEVIGASVTPKRIFEDCLEAKDLIKDVLKDNDELLGILLGFGRHNAHLFWRKTQLEKRLKSNAESAEFQEEYNKIDLQLKSFTDWNSDDFNSHLIGLPGFRADLEHAETKQLKAEYTKQYKKIVKLNDRKDFLEVILAQFCHG